MKFIIDISVWYLCDFADSLHPEFRLPPEEFDIGFTDSLDYTPVHDITLQGSDLRGFGEDIPERMFRIMNGRDIAYEKPEAIRSMSIGDYLSITAWDEERTHLFRISHVVCLSWRWGRSR